MHSTISMGQVGLAFSRRQQCLFNPLPGEAENSRHGEVLLQKNS